MRIQAITPTVQQNRIRQVKHNYNNTIKNDNNTPAQASPSFKGMSAVKILSISALCFTAAGICSVYAPPLAIMLTIPGGLALAASLGQAEIERKNGEGN